MDKKFKIPAEQIVQLIETNIAGIASDRIMVDGMKVDYMYRDEPTNAVDSGWVFLAGDEDEAYRDNDSNFTLYKLNTIANYDPAIIPYLDLPLDTHLERVPGTDRFVPIQ